jgi:MFS superfamily sulfate permease-like transporter
MPAWLVSLLSSGAVWTAFLALVNVVIAYVLPNLPPEIVAAVNVLVVVILAALGINVNKAMRARGL